VLFLLLPKPKIKEKINKTFHTNVAAMSCGGSFKQNLKLILSTSLILSASSKSFRTNKQLTMSDELTPGASFVVVAVSINSRTVSLIGISFFCLVKGIGYEI
jgi:hypothetical protein